MLKGDVSSAVKTLGKIVCNGNVDEAALEAERESARDRHEASHTEYETTLLENVHFNVFRDHMMGQPRRGDPDNLGKLNAEDLAKFHKNNYTGDNVILVGTGGVSHSDLVDLAEQHFKDLPKSSDEKKANSERPIYNPALLFIRDDEMVNSNIGVFYDAPGFKHKDYYSFQLMKRVFGEFHI